MKKHYHHWPGDGIGTGREGNGIKEAGGERHGGSKVGQEGDPDGDMT